MGLIQAGVSMVVDSNGAQLMASAVASLAKDKSLQRGRGSDESHG
jgi:hypothetical protein